MKDRVVPIQNNIVYRKYSRVALLEVPVDLLNGTKKLYKSWIINGGHGWIWSSIKR